MFEVVLEVASVLSLQQQARFTELRRHSLSRDV